MYASNPSVTQALADKLSRFPQFSFTTIDISVLVVIGVLSIVLALKFQRGLRPGIRLERALQMLETLMKRNLFLESQVAELKLEKGQLVPPPASMSPSVESQPGSWERAFRIPIEAGPTLGPSQIRPTTPGPPSSVMDRTPFLQQKPTSRSDKKTMPQPSNSPKFSSIVPEKQETKPVESQIALDSEKTVSFGAGVNPSSWEDSPKHVLETSGILNPPSEARKQAFVMPDSTLVKPASVPPPPMKTPPPPGVIVGPGVSPLPQRKQSPRASPLLPLSKAGPIGLLGPSSQSSRPPPTPVSTVPAQQKPTDTALKPSDEETRASESSEAELGKQTGRPRPQLKKRFAFEEE